MLNVRIEDDIIIAALNHAKTNSINHQMLQQFEEVIDRLNNEASLKGLILIGTGRSFSSGFYLPDLYNFTEASQAIEWFKYEEEVLYKLFTCSKPVIACINGHAVAAGMIYALASDYLIAVDSPRIKLGMSEIKIGLSLPPLQTEVMRYGLLNIKNYKDIIFGARNISPAQALELGIIDELVDHEEQLIEKAKEKICALIDTPSRPFTRLKYNHRRPAALMMRQMLQDCDWQPFSEAFINDSVKATLRSVQASME